MDSNDFVWLHWKCDIKDASLNCSEERSLKERKLLSALTESHLRATDKSCIHVREGMLRKEAATLAKPQPPDDSIWRARHFPSAVKWTGLCGGGRGIVGEDEEETARVEKRPKRDRPYTLHGNLNVLPWLTYNGSRHALGKREARWR